MVSSSSCSGCTSSCSTGASPSFDKTRKKMRFVFTFALAGFAFAAAGSLEPARDRQDRAALQKQIDDAAAVAAKAPNDAEAQYRAGLAYSYLAEVMIEQRERKP